MFHPPALHSPAPVRYVARLDAARKLHVWIVPVRPLKSPLATLKPKSNAQEKFR